ncbi:group-specific protein [Ectobacillus antri]|jgi:predicted Rossmann-fold nucleotide-binding protein|uniref:Group-specific protein n=1 Tax=Ectobacillus antri TaxID=2486280 RepID=A0ABT6H229_9BACI|nr:group-specific protein [Ectobacillus antri]MDG4655540.1 group-specific protein [Ectobacillus antri]MDG5753298.1 group-specific protein [Ectobacillus antri]
MRFYIASEFANQEMVRRLTLHLTEAGWIHTYDWTQNKKATDSKRLKEIGVLEKAAVKEADVFILLLPGGKGSHTELGMALAWGKSIVVCHDNDELATTFYHLPEVNIVQGDIGMLGDYLLNNIHIYNSR